MKTARFNLIKKTFSSSLAADASSQVIIQDPTVSRLLQIRNADSIFNEALRQRDQEQLKRLLADDFFTISPFMLSKAVRIAVRDHNVDLFKLTVEQKDFYKADASFGNNYPIRFAVLHNLVKSVDILLGHPLVNPFVKKNTAVWLAGRLGRQEVKKRLLADPRIHTVNRDNESFLLACKYGESTIVESLLEDDTIDPTYKSNEGIVLAAKGGHSETVKILLGHPDVNPCTMDNKALKEACAHGHEEVVKLLIQHRSINPFKSLPYACRYGHFGVVQILLADHRNLNQIDLNQGLINAICEGHFEIVECLLDKTRVNFNFGKTNPTVTACKCGNLRIIKKLAEDRRYKSGGSSDGKLQDDLNEGLLQACRKNYLDVVEYLLNETIAMPTGMDFDAAQIACKLGHKDVLARLLKDTRVFITERWMFKAAINGHIHILEFLLQNAPEDSIPNMLEMAMAGAQKRNHGSVIAYLKDRKR